MLVLLATMAPLPWGKKPCKVWLDRVLSSSPRRQDDLVVCHPLHLRWARVIEGLDDDIRIFNSATVTYAMKCDWRAAFAMAKDDAPRFVEAFEVNGRLQVDAKDVEIVVANALLDREVCVRAVEKSSSHRSVDLDHTKLAAVYRRLGSSLVLPDEDIVLGGDDVDPSILSCSRDLEPCVWPKCFHFALQMEKGEEERRTFGAVPLTWKWDAHSWSVGSRHRPMAALLAGCQLHTRLVHNSSNRSC